MIWYCSGYCLDIKKRVILTQFILQDQRTLEIYFTAFYDLEVFFKIFCLSFNGYIKRTIHKEPFTYDVRKMF